MRFTLLLLCALGLGACSPPSRTVDAMALQGVMHPVLDRHDEYVMRDGMLSPVEQSSFLRSSKLIREMVTEATRPPE